MYTVLRIAENNPCYAEIHGPFNNRELAREYIENMAKSESPDSEYEWRWKDSSYIDKIFEYDTVAYHVFELIKFAEWAGEVPATVS